MPIALTPAEDTVRILRILEYVGPRSQVEKQIEQSLHGTKRWNGIAITATTLGNVAEIVGRTDALVEDSPE